ncbi:MAG: MurR/RpiR family transcriptional regulator [Erysipelotrichaceae bacterium]|nr:MurR/RpiR family transcriptional regulator [Erysipelotrichaceae bacterium]MDD3809837.1 MurR/RpiR family transcriptional regulator [Erysipelotrichaceae bacterium]
MIIDKINELSNLTAQEMAIREYINANPKALLNLSITDLAQESFTSTSTVIRLCKKLDLKGYGELRYIYASEFAIMQSQRILLKQKLFDESSSIDEIVEMIPQLYRNAVEHTRTMIDRNTLIRITNLIKRASRVEIYGDGVNYDLAKTMAYRFEAVNKDCFVYSASHWEHIEYLRQNRTKTVAILLSHTGKNPMVLHAANELKGQSIHTLAITCDCDSKLAKMAENHIRIVDLYDELEFKTAVFMTCVNYIVDIIVGSLLVHHHDDVVNVFATLKGRREKW